MVVGGWVEEWGGVGRCVGGEKGEGVVVVVREGSRGWVKEEAGGGGEERVEGGGRERRVSCGVVWATDPPLAVYRIWASQTCSALGIVFVVFQEITWVSRC